MNTNGDLDFSFHIESHAALVERPIQAAARRTLDAIVVPTIRPRLLEQAVKLAAEIGCTLVVLCTTVEQAEHATFECGSVLGNLLVAYVPASFEQVLLSFRSAVHPELSIEPSCHADIARKRNVGLMLARLSGWRTIMYLDDDIRDLTAKALSDAVDLTTLFQVVGFAIKHYPDNSVVCHAHRLAGGAQDVFPGGSAVIVDVERFDAFFPPIYNEDWLFLFDAVRARSMAVTFAISQLEYEPFANPRRAASEEFGDVIAEGLFRLLHQGADIADATCGYWRETLERRSMFIDDVAERLLRADGSQTLIGCALMSLAAAKKSLAAISPLACLSFVRAWRADLNEWRSRLLDVPLLGNLEDAAKFLDLPTPDRCVTRWMPTSELPSTRALA